MAADGRPRLWLHGASVGDARALRGLIGALGEAGAALRLTVGRAAGRAVARTLYPALPVDRPPLPLAFSAARALRTHGDALLVLEYLELWPAWMAAAERLGVPVVVVDGRVGPRSLRVRPLLRKAAGRVALFCAQTPHDAENAARLGVPEGRIVVCGNGKHDAARRPVPPTEAQRALGTFDVIVGSLNPAEEGAALAALAARFGGAGAAEPRALLAPRYIGRAPALLAALRRRGVDARLRSEPAAATARVVVLDTVGELSSLYGLGRVAVAGGTFCRREGQNLVEAAAFGVPTLHGPRIANIRAEALALAGRGALEVPDLGAALDHALRVARGEARLPDPRPALADLGGAVARQMAALRPFLEAAARPRYDGAPR